MNEMESVDIAAPEIAAAVMATIHTSDNAAAMRTFKEAAEGLDYRFVKQWSPEQLPEAAMAVLGKALDEPNDSAAGRLIAGLIVGQLAHQGIFLHMGPATANLIRAEQRRREAGAADQSASANDDFVAPSVEVMPTLSSRMSEQRRFTRFVVDLADDQIVVSGPGLLTTYNWRAKAYDNRVARLSMQPTRQVLGAAEEDTYRVVAGDTEGQFRTNASIVADNLSQAEALELIEKIQSAIRASLGIDAVPANDAPSIAPAVNSDVGGPSWLSRLLGRVASLVSRVVWTSCCAVAGAAAVGIAVFVLPIVYSMGRHVGVHLVNLAIGAHPGLLELLS